ncbi:hypothetical protein [Helicobacter japonicus]|nr:hypothetical protein [Helicobacter japonicus]
MIAALSTMVFMQNISSSRTQKTFSLYADLILAQNKAYQALQMHKKALSDEEYNFYKNHIVPPLDSINENAYRTKSTSPFQSLAVVESHILLYLMIFILGAMQILVSLSLDKEAGKAKIENLSTQKILSIKNILKFFMFGFALLALYLVAILLTHSGLLAQRNYRLYWYYKHFCISCRLWNALFEKVINLILIS